MCLFGAAYDFVCPCLRSSFPSHFHLKCQKTLKIYMYLLSVWAYETKLFLFLKSKFSFRQLKRPKKICLEICTLSQRCATEWKQVSILKVIFKRSLSCKKKKKFSLILDCSSIVLLLHIFIRNCQYVNFQGKKEGKKNIYIFFTVQEFLTMWSGYIW